MRKILFSFYQCGRKKVLVLPTSSGENAAHFFEKPVVGALPSSLLPLPLPLPGLHVLVDRERELNFHLLVYALAAEPAAQDPHRSLG
jgi:hypothetical protein